MKITPIAQAGQVQGNISTGSVTPDKKAAAVAAFEGSETRITQSDSYIDPQVAKANESIRKIKMRTNASPDRYEDELEEEVPGVEAPAAIEQVLSAINDANGQSNATTEDTKPL